MWTFPISLFWSLLSFLVVGFDHCHWSRKEKPPRNISSTSLSCFRILSFILFECLLTSKRDILHTQRQTLEGSSLPRMKWEGIRKCIPDLRERKRDREREKERERERERVYGMRLCPSWTGSPDSFHAENMSRSTSSPDSFTFSQKQSTGMNKCTWLNQSRLHDFSEKEWHLLSSRQKSHVFPRQ
jgi:hypothetical protein